MALIGSGGHAGVVIDAVRRLGEFDISHVICEVNGGSKRHGYNVEKWLEEIPYPNLFHFIAIGDNAIRERISKHEFSYVNVFHPSAEYSKQICCGSYFGANSVVGNNSKVGNFSIINTGTILEHDSVVGDYSHLASGVITGGNVKIGSRTMIGLGSIIQDGITIGNNCIIGMGSVVTKDIPDDEIWWGSPAEFQRIKK